MPTSWDYAPLSRVILKFIILYNILLRFYFNTRDLYNVIYYLVN